MPNAVNPRQSYEWPLGNDLRLYEWCCGHPLDRRMQLQKLIDGQWKAAGPYVSGKHTVEMLGEIVRVYRWIADEVESRYKHPDLAKIEDGCPICGALNPDVILAGEKSMLDCDGCARAEKMARYKFPVWRR